jgi:hypothetical protein
VAKPTSRPTPTALPLPVSQPAPPETCGDCRFWHPLAADPDGRVRWGECRRRPPAFVVNPGTFGPKVAYGQTGPNCPACGDGEAK